MIETSLPEIRLYYVTHTMQAKTRHPVYKDAGSLLTVQSEWNSGLDSSAMKRTTLFGLILFATASLSACVSGTDTAVPAKTEEAAKTDETPAQEAPVGELKIVDHTPGQGDEAKPGDTVLVNYTGWLYENGKRTTQFDSSIGREPFAVTIGVTGVITGWTKGLEGMKVGGKRELIIPPDMGYGARGAGGVIPPNATLDFEIEMLKLSKGK
jgi:FKBP-type peptidyl-prolyl cis-trans isomerase